MGLSFGRLRRCEKFPLVGTPVQQVIVQSQLSLVPPRFSMMVVGASVRVFIERTQFAYITVPISQRAQRARLLAAVGCAHAHPNIR